MIRTPTSLLAAVLVLAIGAAAQAEVDQAVLKAEQDRIAAIAKAKAAAVSVFARGGRGGGSGVVVTPDGYALTNYHVVKPAGNIMQCSMPDDVLYDAVIVGIDPVGDVALIKLLGRDDFPHAELGDSDEVKMGDHCFAVGNPFLLATDFQPTVTWGIVSGTHRYQYPAGTLLEYADCIQTDASINPGNSGGPLFNARGQLIGINGRGSFEKRGRVNVGVGYAISINQIKHFMGYLRSGRIVDHATMGANVASDENGRVVVSNILESSDAYRRGLRYEDEIVSFGGRPIGTVNGFKNVLGIFPKGWRVPLTYRREGKQYDIYVRLKGVHPNDQLIEKLQRQPQQPQPMPGEPKKEDDEKKDDGEKEEDDPPKRPRPAPNRPMPIRPAAPAAPPVSEEAQKLYKARHGYANYYFNELNRDRVWKAFTDGGDFTSLSQPWTFRGQLAGAAAEITLSSAAVSATFPGGPASLDPAKDLDQQLEPAGSGGLLAALHVWHRMLTVGPKSFGDVYYLGTAPLADSEGLFDVLVGTHNVIEARFYFDPATGRMAAIDFMPADDEDPCEVRLGDYQPVDGRLVPHSIEVRYGDRRFGTLEWQQISLTNNAE